MLFSQGKVYVLDIIGTEHNESSREPAINQNTTISNNHFTPKRQDISVWQPVVFPSSLYERKQAGLTIKLVTFQMEPNINH